MSKASNQTARGGSSEKKTSPTPQAQNTEAFEPEVSETSLDLNDYSYAADGGGSVPPPPPGENIQRTLEKLHRADTGSRTRLMRSLQKTYGNNYVARMFGSKKLGLPSLDNIATPAQDLVNTAQNTAGNFIQDTSNVAHDIKNIGTDSVENLAGNVENGVASTHNLVKNVRNGAQNIAGNVQNGIDNAQNIASDVAQTVNGAQDTAQNFAANAQEGAQNLVGNVQDGAQNLVGNVTQTVNGAQNTAANVVEGAQNVAGNLNDKAAEIATPGEMPAAQLTEAATEKNPAAQAAASGMASAQKTLEKAQQLKTTNISDASKKVSAVVSDVAANGKSVVTDAKAALAPSGELAAAAKGKPGEGVKPGDMKPPDGAPDAPRANDSANVASGAEQTPEPVDENAPLDLVAGKADAANMDLGTIQRTPATALEPPVLKPALAPDQDPNFVAVKGKAKATATKEKTTEPAAAKANEAQGAAVPPSNEVSSQAGANQVGKMNQQEAGAFDKAAFVAAVRQAVEAVTPKSEDEADKFKESGKAGQIKQQVQGMVGTNKETAEKNIETTANEAPDTGNVKPKQVTPMKAEEVGDQPGKLGAENAMPKPKDAEETSLAYGPNKLNKQMEDAKVTEEQLQKSNEPTFTGALDEKKKVEQDAATAPGEFRTKEQALLAQAKQEVGASSDTAMAGMHAARGTTFGNVSGEKDETKSKDEEARTKIAGELDKIYAKSKEKVTKILTDLDGKVEKEFESGEKAVREEFENYVKQRMDAYKDERYGGLFGWTNRVVDAFAGMPAEVNAFYTEGRNKYLTGMDKLINRIADIVGAELTAAKNEIANGLQEVQKYITSLPQNLQKIGLEAQQDIQDKFNDLKSEVDEKQNALVDTLAQKYVASRDAVDSRIKEMQEENKGLVDKAVGAIKGVIDTIIQLKDMLLGVLARAAAAVDKIIKDPIGFLSNLISAIKQGLGQFVSNIMSHLQKGLLGWLTGTLGDAGLRMPGSLDFRGILDLVLQIMGMTWQNVRSRIVKATSEKFVGRLEKAAEVIMILINEGPAGLWKYIQGEAAAIYDQVIEGIKDWVITKVIQAGVSWLISTLNPAGAFIAAVRGIIAVVQFVMERGSQIMSFVNSVLDSVEAIASGSIGGAANAIENSLSKALPLAISFLANLLGLGGISQKIKNIIGKVQRPVNNAIDKVINGTVAKFKGLFKKEDEKKHKEMAKEADTALKKAPAARPATLKNVLQEKEQTGKQLESASVPKLANEDKVKMTVTFQQGDAYTATQLKYTVKIAPNDTTSTGAVDVVSEKTLDEAKQAAEKAKAEAAKVSKAKDTEEKRKAADEASKKADAHVKALEKDAADLKERKEAEAGQRAAARTTVAEQLAIAKAAAKEAEDAAAKVKELVAKIDKANKDATAALTAAKADVDKAKQAVKDAPAAALKDAAKKKLDEAKKAKDDAAKKAKEAESLAKKAEKAATKAKEAADEAKKAMQATQQLADDKDKRLTDQQQQFQNTFDTQKPTGKPSLQLGELDQHGRPTGTLIELGPKQIPAKDQSKKDLNIGTEAGSFKPAGWPDNNADRYNAKLATDKAKREGKPVNAADEALGQTTMNNTHLYGAEMGGSGEDPRNLVTALDDMNKRQMREIEKEVREAARNGPVMYKVTPQYTGTEKEPTTILIEYKTSDGKTTRYEVTNKHGASSKKL